MRLRLLLFFIAFLTPVALTTFAASEAATQPCSGVNSYDGFENDAAVLRDVTEGKLPDGRTIRVSTAKAQDAARRIFSRVAFLHRSRSEVLSILGDPKTISDYGRAAGDDKSDPLVYVFDSGRAGFTYTLNFRTDVCVGVFFEIGG